MASILVVDDDAYVRATFRVFLVRGGHEVREAAGGREAPMAVGEAAPDLVLCDLFMPGMNGRETIWELARLHPAVPVLAMGGDGASECCPDLPPPGGSRGLSGALPKPIGKRALLAAVDRALAH